MLMLIAEKVYVAGILAEVMYDKCQRSLLTTCVHIIHKMPAPGLPENLGSLVPCMPLYWLADLHILYNFTC